VKDSLKNARRTKIVATVGPATQTRENLAALMDAGMNVARLNFSHAEAPWHRERIQLLREIAAERNQTIGILIDCPGPKLRIGKIPTGPIELHTGDTFRLVTDETPGNHEQVSISYLTLPEEVHPGDQIFLGDGDVELQVERTEPGVVHCHVISGGPLSSRKGMNFPTRSLSVPAVTDRDREGIQLAVDSGADFVALSFVRTADDVRSAREVILAAGAEVPLIAKIEKHEALDNLEAILEESDGLLVARGDLAVDIPLEDVPQAQKRIISAANNAGKPVITATQMLRSMVTAPRPTRAETTDVANALYDGTDAVMLSEETAIGAHAAAAVSIMDRICRATERNMHKSESFRRLPPGRHDSVPDVVAAAAALVSRLLNADAVLVPTRTGSTAIKMAEFRPRQPILAISTHPLTVGRMTLSWGVWPLLGREVPSHEDMLSEAERIVREAGIMEEGDLAVITAGFPVGGPGSTNTVTVKRIGEQLSPGSWGDEDQQTLFEEPEES
jgi:pyruvate kinase